MPDHVTRAPDPAAFESEDQKPGRPPRPSTEPAHGAAPATEKTRTDPATGEDHGAPKGSEKTRT